MGWQSPNERSSFEWCNTTNPLDENKSFIFIWKDKEYKNEIGLLFGTCLHKTP